MTEICRHDMDPRFCADCRNKVRGLPARVYITAAGKVFHTRRACGALRAGWEKSIHFGHEPTPLQSISLSEAQAKGLGGCKDCYASLALGG